MSRIIINHRVIASGHPAYVVAEMSANHHQDYDRAVRIIEAAKEAGADAIKLQTYTADTITLNCDSKYFRIEGTLWDGRTLHDLYREAYTPWEWQPKLKIIADKLGLDLFSSPFDPTAVDFLERMGIPAYKVASSELVDIPLLKKIASVGKPIIMSTGMATLGEIEEAVRTIRGAGCDQLALLHCTSVYPAPPEDLHLRTLSHLAEAFSVPVGISDHSLGIEVAIAAVVLGACIIEKHFTLSRSDHGPDSAFSLEPREFKAMVEAVRTIEKALGVVKYGASEREQISRRYRRSLFVVENVKAGEEFTEKNVKSIRPGDGLHPRYLSEVIGRTARCDVKKGTPLGWDLIGQPRPNTDCGSGER